MAGPLLRARLQAGEPCLGTFCAMGSPAAAEFLAAEAFDFLVVDGQHGLGGQAELVATLQALDGAGTPALVRVPAGDDAAIERALDAGAVGIVAPAVESADRAAEVVSRCRYPPAGTRSFGPVRSELRFGLDPEEANERVLCVVMIETRAGLAATEEICATTGVDGVYVGPADLAVGLGLPPATAPVPGEHADAIERVRVVARGSGRVAGIHAGTGRQAAARAAEGFALVTVGTDATLLRSGARRMLRDARGAGDTRGAHDARDTRDTRSARDARGG